MKTFKDYLNDDIQDVFLNPNEFAELHLLDGTLISMVIEKEIVDSKTGLGQEFEDATQGIFETVIVLILKAVDYKKPLVGAKVKLDGKYYYVINAFEDYGMLTIKLGANES